MLLKKLQICDTVNSQSCFPAPLNHSKIIEFCQNKNQVDRKNFICNFEIVKLRGSIKA